MASQLALDADEEALPVAPVDLPPSAALARLGPEGLLRLRARHAEVLARISERVADPARQEELKSLAERLNPDTWVTEDEVRRGLDEYETTFEALRTVVGRPRKRRRRRGPRPGSEGPSDAGSQGDELQSSAGAHPAQQNFGEEEVAGEPREAAETGDENGDDL